MCLLHSVSFIPFHLCQLSSNYGIMGWPWEVAYVFTETLANVCLYGKSAEIKKLALTGDRAGVNVTRPQKREGESENADMTKLKSAGLLDLAELERKDANDGELVLCDTAGGIMTIFSIFSGYTLHTIPH